MENKIRYKVEYNCGGGERQNYKYLWMWCLLCIMLSTECHNM